MIRLAPGKFFTVVMLMLVGSSLLIMAALFMMRQQAGNVRLTASDSAMFTARAVPTLVQAASAVASLIPTVSATSIAIVDPAGAPLFDPLLSLMAGPVDVPLEIHIPALNINAPVLGVGLTLNNVMASPIGIRPNDPIWESVFWYRGGSIPGEIGTATFAGHFDDADGLPAIFAFLSDLRAGDLIIVRDTRSGHDVSFVVTETRTYTNQEAADPAVLARVFGAETSDQLSHLTLITCTGAWIDESFDLRLVVYATRVN